MTETPVLWTASEAAAATGGNPTRDWRAAGLSIDSRTTAPGDLFIALAGPVFDGHAFVADALATGAAAALVARTPDDAPDDAPLLIVDDTMAALNALGAASRKRAGARIAAVTGSVGKTGTKEALRHVLGRQGATTASVSSFNNHWGVPLSLARMPADAAFGVFEVGMNHAGEVSPLSRLIRPDVAIITTVEMVHSEFFDSVEAIADAKAEIFDGMAGGGTAILNRDNPQFARLERAARAAGVAAIAGFGSHDDAAARLIDCVLEPGASEVTADFDGTVIDYRVGVAGRHWVMNSLAVLAAARALGVDLESAARALADLPALDGRGRTHEVRIAGGRFTLVDESYNANPISMRALIETLANMIPGAGGRRIAVLGDMRELGSASAALHAGLAAPLTDHGIDVVFAAGDDMAHLCDALPAAMRGGHAASGDELADIVRGAIRDGDVIAVKGSNASRMDVVVRALLQCEAAPAHAAESRI